MRRLSLLLGLIGWFLVVPGAWAQPEPEEEPATPPVEEEEGPPAEELDDDDVRLRAPVFEPPALPELEPPPETEVTQEVAEEEAEEEVEEDDDEGWLAPSTALTLHGYLRVRGELHNNFFLSRSRIVGQATPDLPFERFRPLDRNVTPMGGCSGEPTADITMAAACGNSDRLRFANMRLRLEPEIHLSDDVRVMTQIDIFDNLVLGSTPNSTFWVPDEDGFARTPSAVGVPLDTVASSQLSPQGYRNSLSDALIVRRAWAEVHNRGLGELRFGRMPSHWGLGMLQHGGDGLDQDFQTDVDRIMGITRLAGFYFMAGWDFANEGFIRNGGADPYGLAFDATQEDDVNQFVFSAARQMDADDQADELADGGWALNGGLYFMFRKQHLSSAAIADPFADPEDAGSLLFRRDARLFMPDVWVQFLWGDLRIEMEAALVAGSITNARSDQFQLDEYDVLQFGLALEAEYRLLNDKLGIYLYGGFATGDPDVEGLSLYNDLLNQDASPNGNNDVTTFQFHPAYRIDLILWRNIMGAVAGAYYFRPGASYDVIRDASGQRLGFRFDLIYSRATHPVQTWGSDADLGVELNLSAYYRSADGPGLMDGFYAQFQYGVLFPLDGLGYPTFNEAQPDTVEDTTSLGRAQALRLLLGVEF